MTEGQPILLLDCVLGHQAPGLGQRMADHRYRQRRGFRYNHEERRTGQPSDPSGVQVRSIQLADKRPNVLITPAPDPLSASRRSILSSDGPSTKNRRIAPIPGSMK
jgi:hypothetical protein